MNGVHSHTAATGGGMPPAMEGFEHVNRYWDKTNNTYAAKILPGEFYVTRNRGELITTVLGSCISVCIRDPLSGIGGMNHFMLPVDSKQNGAWGATVAASTRYGTYAMEQLINRILQGGGNRNRFEIKVFGGGRVMSGVTDVGKKNIAFIHHYLKVEGFELLAQDVGDVYPRKVLYFPSTGRVRLKKLRAMHNDTIIQRERAYFDELADEPVQGEIELF